MRTVSLAAAAMVILGATHAFAGNPDLDAFIPACDDVKVGESVVFETEYRPGVDDPADLGDATVVGVALTYQCRTETAGGAMVPEGWRVDLLGQCSDDQCPVGTSVLVVEFGRDQWSGDLVDPRGHRAMKLGWSRKENAVLTINTLSNTTTEVSRAKYRLQPASDALAARLKSLPMVGKDGAMIEGSPPVADDPLLKSDAKTGVPGAGVKPVAPPSTL